MFPKSLSAPPILCFQIKFQTIFTVTRDRKPFSPDYLVQIHQEIITVKKPNPIFLSIEGRLFKGDTSSWTH